MSGENILKDGFDFVKNLSRDEIIRRIKWIEERKKYLESNLSIYKTLLILKELEENQPEDFELPREWVSAVDEDRLEKTSYHEYDRLISSMLADCPGMRQTDIARKLNKTSSDISSYLTSRSDYYERREKLWYLRNGALAALSNGRV